jgi:redox-sensing transcriptional repressor
MMMATNTPEIVIRRLPLYARALQWLDLDGVQTISSAELGAQLGMTPAQIRKDLSYFGEFGKQGMGYDVKFLYDQLRHILASGWLPW